MICKQGDIIQVSFDPSVGHEPRKTRPGVVVSCDRFNLMSSLTMVTPITSTDNGYPLHIPITGHDDIHGCVCVEQIRALDLQHRRCEHIGIMNEHDMARILEAIGAVYDI